MTSLFTPDEMGPPSPDLSWIAGKWVMLVDDEDFDPAHNKVIELPAPQEPSAKLVLDTGDGERLVLSGFDQGPDALSGLIYWTDGRTLPEGDPGELWKALEGAPTDDPRFDELPICDAVRLYRYEPTVFGEQSPGSQR